MVIGRKLFEEIDKPIGYKIIDKNSFGIESEASWTGIIKGYNGFTDGKNTGSGNSFQGTNGVIISNWEGVFTTNNDDDDDGEQIALKSINNYVPRLDKLIYLNFSNNFKVDSTSSFL